MEIHWGQTPPLANKEQIDKERQKARDKRIDAEKELSLLQTSLEMDTASASSAPQA